MCKIEPKRLLRLGIFPIVVKGWYYSGRGGGVVGVLGAPKGPEVIVCPCGHKLYFNFSFAIVRLYFKMK